MNSSTKKPLNIASFAVLLGALASLIVLSACESSGSSSSSKSTLTGNVSSFKLADNVFTPTGAEQEQLAGQLENLSDLLISAAHADEEGVVVVVEGTGRRGTTQSDGSFTIFGVPAGPQTLVFTFNGETATFQIDVPARSTITLSNIQITASGVTISRIEIESNDDDSSDDSSDDDSSDDDSDDSDDDDSDDDASSNTI